jgi:limonene-1,2-epoxide hydrolase
MYGAKPLSVFASTGRDQWADERLSRSKIVARRFVAAWNSRSLVAFDEILHPAFAWHVVVVGGGEPSLGPIWSRPIGVSPLSLSKVLYDKAETIEVLRACFSGSEQFNLRITSITAENDRVVLELLGAVAGQDETEARRDANCYVLEMKDGQIVLLREYIDLLQLYDA